MADTAVRLATYDDILALPANMVGQIIHGVLHAVPRPRPRHALATSRLGVGLGSAFDDKGGVGPGGWLILDEPELHLGPDVLVPDLAGWRQERMPCLPDTAWFETPPDWVCEVLSPSTMSLDRVQKAEIYLSFGVSHLWLVDPEARTLEAYEAREHAARREWARIAALAEEADVAVRPFDAASFSLSRLWAD